MNAVIEQDQQKQWAALFLLGVALAVVVMIIPEHAHAGTGGQPFDTVWQNLKDWMQGTLGRIICAAFVLVGLIAGVARQSMMAFAIGLSAGFGLYYTPDIIESIVTATLPHGHWMLSAAHQLSNGLIH